MNDYDRIARIIEYLDSHHTRQPDLTELASMAGLSPHHFHRLFTRWAGATPKEFLQALTFAHSRKRLADGHPLLETALDSGLSGPGRLHDLCLKLEAASPGEIRSGGAGWTLKVGYADTPFGTARIAQSPRGLCALAFETSPTETSLNTTIRELWPNAGFVRDDEMAQAWANRIFHPTGTVRPEQSLRAHVRATPFQIRVWQALLAVPEGALSTYGRIAHAIGKEGAARAVGNAIGSNPIAYLIPCHRVIRETGALGGYRWGRTRKTAMLAREALAQVDK
ncbi:methylated-DNA--[protein]-cysteine S-methyltransferase [Coraliomargarita parva]|uniref:methylated-DNA--[protein]-cysteine S-methyltransferase n=1 Tax=Coraliomargarita parva TaxID=3014050 RepID=UPI0022B2CB69|nr:methylated-DNA--[protein]-cysteine S-methyltransferase [Coraliomargarita parva]